MIYPAEFLAGIFGLAELPRLGPMNNYKISESNLDLPS